MYVCKSQKKTFILDYMYIEWNLTLKKEILKSLNQDIESEFLGTFKLFLIQKKKKEKKVTTCFENYHPKISWFKDNSFLFHYNLI